MVLDNDCEFEHGNLNTINKRVTDILQLIFFLINLKCNGHIFKFKKCNGQKIEFLIFELYYTYNVLD